MQLSDQTGGSLKNIIGAVEETAHTIGEIAAATVQQAARPQEVRKAIEAVARRSEQTAAGSEEWPQAARNWARRPPCSTTWWPVSR